MTATTNPLSPAQQRLWFLDQFTPRSPLYNFPLAFDLEGPLDVAAIGRSLGDIRQRHETLRTTFPAVEGLPYLRIQSSSAYSLPVEDLSHLSDAEYEGEVSRRLVSESQHAFDLASGPLFRAVLLRLDTARHVLIVVVHHIVFDTWSASVFLRELTALYSSHAAGRSSPLPDLPLKYPVAARRRNEWLQSEACAKQLAYWKEHLKPPRPLLALPTDHARPAEQSYRGHREHLLLSENLITELDQLGRRHGATLFVTLLAAYATFLHRYTGQEDLLIGSQVPNRAGPELEPLIGPLANMLALRLDLTGEPTFRHLLDRVNRVVLSGCAHQDFPFETLIEHLNPDRSLSHPPILQAAIVLDDAPHATASPLTAGPLTIRRRQVDTGTSEFDLTLLTSRTDIGWRATLELSADLFYAATGTRMLRQYARLLKGIAENPERPIDRLPLVPDEERHQVLVEWNATVRPYPSDKTLVTLFEGQVVRTPEAIALVCGTERVTYASLNALANRCAGRLRSMGIEPDDRIAICLDRSTSLIVWLLGILKAGAAYVPLDPAYPTERLAFIVEDAHAKVLVTRSRFAARLPSGSWPVIDIDRQPASLERSRENGEPVARPEHLAYVIYTSGSTGKPKGVAIEHRSAVNLVSWALDAFSRDELAGVMASTSISFDVSVFELFATLSSGGSILLVDDVFALPSGSASEVTLISTVPSAMVELLRNGDLPPNINVVALAGEPLPQDLVDRLYERVGKVMDLYGPTETTVYATCAIRTPHGVSTIGRPIANTKALVLDQSRQPVPIGLPGELCLGGIGLARGYLGRPELTAERFLPDPFSDDAADRLYRTGDLARWRADGTLEFLGRLDRQVKLRGFRIELDEIEAVLREHPLVHDAVVAVRDEREGTRLVAYTINNEAVSHDQLREYLARRLPEYMIPSAFFRLDELPKLPNGKVDRAALATLTTPQVVSSKVGAPPLTSTEATLARLWSDLLHEPQVGVDQDFFQLGGHSLLAVHLFTQIERQFGVKLPLSSLFRNGTIREQARFLTNGGSAQTWSPIVPLQTSGARPPFFLVHGIGGEVLSFEALARSLAPDQPIYGIQADTRDGAGFFSTVREVATTYLRHVRELAPSGPYLLGGYSSGGTIAYEMAQQLRAAGEQVAALVMLDSEAPGGAKVRLNPIGVWRILGNAAYWFVDDEFFSLSRRDQFARIASKVRTMYAGALRVAGNGNGESKADIRDQLGLWNMPEESRGYLEAHFNMLCAYRPRPYAGRVTVLRARTYGLISRVKPDLGWQSLAVGGVRVRKVPGAHNTILRQPLVRVLATALDMSLREHL